MQSLGKHVLWFVSLSLSIVFLNHPQPCLRFHATARTAHQEEMARTVEMAWPLWVRLDPQGIMDWMERTERMAETVRMEGMGETEKRWIGYDLLQLLSVTMNYDVHFFSLILLTIATVIIPYFLLMTFPGEPRFFGWKRTSRSLWYSRGE